MSNFISERYEESHKHLEGTCVESHKRTINDKTYIFTRVSMRSGTSLVSAYKKTVVFDRSHQLGNKQ